MLDYIKDCLEAGWAPPKIYDAICKALEDKTLSEKDRQELLRQKEKAREIAVKLSDIFKFTPTDI